MVRRKTTKSSKKRNKPRHDFEIKPKTPGQQKYLDSINNNIVTICNGPAGSGKSLIAIGSAMKFYHAEPDRFTRIIIVRPAIEACGESLGYLPGTAEEKMRPFIEPILDNLRVFIRDEGYISSLLAAETGPIIQIAPMAYLRGRTFNNCIIIFDEAQNATIPQMKLFLTRIGRNCKVIIEGDARQSDINFPNGLSDAMNRFKSCSDIGLVQMARKDVVRSELVANILERYE